MTGRWFLEYTSYNEMESIGNEVEQIEIPLVATDEVTAITEAKAIWHKKVQEAKAYWEKQKRTWVHPPIDPFNGLNPDPRVTYRIPL